MAPIPMHNYIHISMQAKFSWSALLLNQNP